MQISTDAGLHEFAEKTNAKNPMEVVTGIRLEECYQLIMEAGLLTVDEWRSGGGPNYEMLTLAFGRIPKKD